MGLNWIRFWLKECECVSLMMVGRVKNPSTTSTATSTDAMAMSLDEADAVLAKHGYVDAEAALV